MRALFKTIVPGWKGTASLHVFPRQIRWLLYGSLLILQVYSLLNYGKVFAWLSDNQKEKLIQKLYNHPSARIRHLVQWWKLTALMLQS
ncbi:MAG: hypothetical protein KatS3mg031_0643 [Chitinophagales bacterium]|nr:MAG: hypothetical protein KatS3mg031_0643 [Chitinophagales bacterium]